MEAFGFENSLLSFSQGCWPWKEPIITITSSLCLVMCNLWYRVVNNCQLMAFLLPVQLQRLQVQGAEEQRRDGPGGGLANGHHEQLYHGGKEIVI